MDTITKLNYLENKIRFYYQEKIKTNDKSSIKSYNDLINSLSKELETLCLLNFKEIYTYNH